MPQTSTQQQSYGTTNNTGTTSNTGTGTSTTTGQSPTDVAASNLAAIPGLSDLTSLINAINQSSQTSANYGRIPGEQGLETQSSQNIASALAGNVSGGTQNLLRQQAAESGASSGSASPAAYLRLLGLTSEQMQGTGQDWLSAATSRNPAARTYDPSTGLLSPTNSSTTTSNTTNTGTTTNQGNTTNTSAGTTTYPDQTQQQQPTGGTSRTQPQGGSFSLNDLLGSLTGGGGVGYPGLTGTDTGAGGGLDEQWWADLMGYNMGGGGGVDNTSWPSQFGGTVDPTGDLGDLSWLGGGGGDLTGGTPTDEEWGALLGG